MTRSDAGEDREWCWITRNRRTVIEYEDAGHQAVTGLPSGNDSIRYVGGPKQVKEHER